LGQGFIQMKPCLRWPEGVRPLWDHPHPHPISHHGDCPLDDVVATSFEDLSLKGKNRSPQTTLVGNISFFPMCFAHRFGTPLRPSLAHDGVNAAPSCRAQVLITSWLQSTIEGETHSDFESCCLVGFGGCGGKMKTISQNRTHHVF